MKQSGSSRTSNSIAAGRYFQLCDGERREPAKFLTIKEVAVCVGVATRTVSRWIDEKLLVAHKVGRLVRIAESDLEAFLTKHRAA